MKAIRIHKAVAKAIEPLGLDLRRQIAELLALLAEGASIGLPVSRPMPSVASGAHELRLRDRSGSCRAFYYTKVKDAILVFHFFKKKTQATPNREIKIAISRLKEML